MKTFTTRAEAVEYLVSRGKPRVLARAAIDEAFNYEDVSDKRGLLFVANEEEQDYEPATVSETEVRAAYDKVVPTFKVTNQGIWLDGLLRYNLDGELLK